MAGKTVLIAENDGIISLDLKALLNSYSYKAVLARSPETLIERYKADKPDLIIADLSLGKDSNEPALKNIRELGNTPIILLSGSTRTILEKLAKTLNPCSFLTKPFDKTELLTTVKKQLGE